VYADIAQENLSRIASSVDAANCAIPEDADALAVACAVGADQLIIPPLSLAAREKRILITHSLVRKHRELAAKQGFRSSFIATGCCLPLDRSEDAKVKMQNVPQYKYSELVTEEAIDAQQAKIAEEAKLDIAAKAVLEGARQADVARALDVLAVATSHMNPSKQLGDSKWPLLGPVLRRLTAPVLSSVATTLGQDFVIAGSYVAAMMCDALRETEPLFVLTLPYNDIDVYYGSFGVGEFTRSYPKHHPVDVALGKDVNWIQCVGLNTSYLITHSDINACTGLLHVKVDAKSRVVMDVETILPAPLWHFLLHDRTLRTLLVTVPVQTCIRLAFKSFQMNLPFEFGDIKINDGAFFKSHLAKLEQLEKWDKNPFVGMEVRKGPSQSYLLIRSKNHVACASISSHKANAKCALRMCKACCMKNPARCGAHKGPHKKAAAQEKAAALARAAELKNKGQDKPDVVQLFQDLVNGMVSNSRDGGASSVHVVAGDAPDTRTPFSCAAFRTALLDDKRIVTQLRLPQSQYGDPRDVLQVMQELGALQLQGSQFELSNSTSCSRQEHMGGVTTKISKGTQIDVFLPLQTVAAVVQLDALLASAFEPKVQDRAEYQCNQCDAKVRVRACLSLRVPQPTVLCISINRTLRDRAKVAVPTILNMSLYNWQEHYALVSALHYVSENHHTCAVRFDANSFLMYDSGTAGCRLNLQRSVDGTYPFSPEQGIAYYYVVKSALRGDFAVCFAPLPSLAWFDNNCFVNAALHAAAGLGLWVQRDEDEAMEEDEEEMNTGEVDLVNAALLQLAAAGQYKEDEEDEENEDVHYTYLDLT
jgi:hypothetical protein